MVHIFKIHTLSVSTQRRKNFRSKLCTFGWIL